MSRYQFFLEFSISSILEPLLNLFLADMFFIVDAIGIASYADDNTPYVSGNDKDAVTESLKKEMLM